MLDVAFVVAPGASLAELAAAVGAELTQQGMAVSSHESFPAPDLTRLYVLADPDHWVRERGEQLLPGAGVLRRTLLLSAADPASISSHHDLYARAGRVFDVGQEALVVLRRAGIDGHLLHPGYRSEWDRFDPVAPRPVDVVRVQGRGAAPADLAGLASARIAVVPAHGRWLAMPEIVTAMHSGAVVVSEHGLGLAPFVAGEHLFLASPEALPHVVDDLLGDDERLARVRAAAHERLRGWLPFAASVAMLRAALLELLGRPLA